MDPYLHQALTHAATMPLSTPSHPSPPVVTRIPPSILGPVRARRHRFSRFLHARAHLKGTALVVETSAGLFATLDVQDIALHPNGRVHVRSRSPPASIELRFDENRTAWVAALRNAIRKRAPSLTDFEVVAPIGKGGGGAVFLVREKGDDRPLAMKVVQKHDAFHTDGSLRHALDERVVLELVRGFPFVVTLRHAFQTNTALYMVSDFCAGGNLRTLLGKHNAGRMPEDDAKRIMVQIILALEHLHQLNVIYRDLKPDNVLLSADGDVRLCDFGLSKLLSTGRFGRTRSFCGSTSYMSPQIVTNKSYGIATDLWSLGALFYRMLVGRAPFDQSSNQLGSRNKPEDIQRRIQLEDPSFPSFLSANACEMLEGLLRKDEERRTNLQDLKEALFFEGVNWDEELEQGYKRAATPNLVSVSTELDNFDSQRLLSHGVALEDKELNPAKKVINMHADSPREERKGFATRRRSNLGAFSFRKPSSLTRKADATTSIVGFGFTSIDDLSVLSPSGSDSSESLHEA